MVAEILPRCPGLDGVDFLDAVRQRPINPVHDRRVLL
jgi:hypothetical protein